MKASWVIKPVEAFGHNYNVNVIEKEISKMGVSFLMPEGLWASEYLTADCRLIPISICTFHKLLKRNV